MTLLAARNIHSPTPPERIIGRVRALQVSETQIVFRVYDLVHEGAILSYIARQVPGSDEVTFFTAGPERTVTEQRYHNINMLMAHIEELAMQHLR